ncbi:hypothetical protein CUT44_26980 [Streptomyces carminius]|uniref:Serine/arginine repetitive matrix protein 2 n=1 Tax=Streptomyces carminius TaxID=2665496 RepID=A0A2M8LS75_9ACTN|nr:hypothetical protein [Streptomyces carminius]PJE94797.1 hypothetical protein CUT44_26980 [Streptomyces carminius]
MDSSTDTRTGPEHTEPYWDEDAAHWVTGVPAPPPFRLRQWRLPDRVWPLPPDHARKVAAVAAAAVLATGGGVGWALWDGDDGTERTPGADTAPVDGGVPEDGFPLSSPSPTPPGPSSDSADSAGSFSDAFPSEPAGSPEGPPEGMRRVRDEAGFTLDVPEGWERSENEQGVFYTSPDGASLLQVFSLTEVGQTPREALEVAEEGVSANPGYELIRLAETGPDAAELEYAYDSEEAGGRRRVIDRAFEAADGVQYAVLVAGPADDWPTYRRLHRDVLAAFCPGDLCPAGPADPTDADPFGGTG